MSQLRLLITVFALSLAPVVGQAEASVSDGTVQAGGLAPSAVAAASTSPVEASFEGAVVDGRRSTAAALDISYYFVLGLGVAGLVWMRRQAQSL